MVEKGDIALFMLFSNGTKSTRRNKTNVLINIKCADVYGITDDVDLILVTERISE